MKSLSLRLWLAAAVAALLAFAAACGGSGGTTTPIPGEAFSLLITANPDTGTAPLSVSFFAVPSGGVAPYTYAWDFNQDGITDSNAPSSLFVYTASGKAKVTVTDHQGGVVTASRTVTITGNGNPQPSNVLDVRFNASPQVGNVPFNCQFTAFVTGGKAPYSYSWDFDGDGTFDSFLQNPVYTYEKVGEQISGNTYVFYPILQVRDGRGVEATNLDDNDNNGNPDFKMAINSLPSQGGLIVAGSANPSSGQAPLSVEFTGSVTGGSGNIEYHWLFGDGQESPYAASSLSNHTYTAAGTYLATVTARDNTTGEIVTSSPITIDVSQSQTLSVTIVADSPSGQVPFLVNFQALPVNGKEPINYQWDIFTDRPEYHDLDPTNDPSPGLDSEAVVTPDKSSRKNPVVHFGNTASAGNASFDYVARCVAIDSLGNTAVSNYLKITAQPRTNPAGPAGANGYYEASRPMVTLETFFPKSTGDPSLSANPVLQAPPTGPYRWSARANAATSAHQSGITFIFGGEILDENGVFQRLVDRGDSAYCFVPNATGTGVNQGPIGEWADGNDYLAAAGSMIHLNDNFAPAFPGAADSHAPPQVDGNQPPAQEPPTPTLRSAPFQIVGSAAAIFIHEPVETNDENQYPSHSPRDPAGDDVNLPDADYGYSWYGVPDSPTRRWKIDTPESLPPVVDGLGVPVVYVLGGRTDATTPTDLIQKYIVPGFGSEKVPAYSQDYSFQATCNQTDIWSPEFARSDTDQYAGTGRNFDPQISDRTPGQGGTQQMPSLPRPLYGLMAARVETGTDTATPAFPNGPFHYIFAFGGIDASGQVRDEMYWWDTSLGIDQGQEPGEDGVFSEVAQMPTPRAYGKAVFIPGNPMRIALIGGYDNNGAYIKTVDIFTFNSIFAPNTGSWSTFAGSLTEGLRALGAGYHPGPGNEKWVLALSGWTGKDFSTQMSTARLFSPGNLVVAEGMPLAPRANQGSSQSAMQVLSNPLAQPTVSFNRYYLLGGVDENGVENFVEVCSLP